MLYFLGVFIAFVIFTLVLEVNRDKIPPRDIEGMYAGVILASLLWVITLPLSFLISIPLVIRRLISKFKR